MKQKLKVALDIDDVLAAFYPGMCEKFNRKEIKCNYWDNIDECKWIADKFHIIENDPEFWESLWMIATPNTINFEVSAYITSSPKPMLESRRKWLFDRKNDIYPNAPVFYSNNKLELMQELGIDLLIDDKPSTVETVNNGGLLALQFKPDYSAIEIEDKSKIITHLSEINNWL